MADFLRLILLILLLPLIIIVIGPLLILAAVRGHQQMGPITLDSTRYNSVGRAGILLLGAAIWLLVWGGLAYLAIEALTPTLGAVVVQITPTPPPSTGMPTPLPSTHTPAPASATAAVTRRPAQTPLPSATAAVAPAVIVETPAPTATAARPTTTPAPSATATPPATATSPPPASATPPTTATSTPPASTTPKLLASTPTAASTRISRVSLADQQAAIATVKQANELLRQAIAQASEQNLNNLERLWRGQALTGAKSYATEVNSRFTEPFDVQLDYVTPLTVSDQSVPRQIVVFSNEHWTYDGLSQVDQENYEFIYTVIPTADGWAISRYMYRNSPENQPTATP